jgi:signal peptide peptidase SppA
MKHLAHVASRFVNCPLMIHPPKLEVIIKALAPRLGIDPDIVLANRVPMDATGTLMARYAEAGEERDYNVLDGIAVIPVQGTLLKKESFMSAWSGATSYEQIQRQVASAIDDAGVRAILLDIDSPGGETTGCFELSDYIYSVRGIKPVYAAANDIALSAAYAVASAASKVFVTRTGAVGSVGVYALHVDQSGFDKDLGAKYTYIFGGDKKVDGNPHEPLSESAKGDIQDEVDREYGIFTETVARNRKVAKKQIVATQAGLLWAENAVPLLADAVGTIDDAMNALSGVLGARSKNSTAATAAIPTKGEHMNDEVQALAAKKEGEAPDNEVKKSKKETEESGAKERDGKKPPADNEEDDEDEAKSKKDDGKKKAASATMAATQPSGMRAEGDIEAIGALCKMAGCPEKAAEFLTKKKSNGQYFTVAEVSQELTAARVIESERSMITSHVNPNQGATGSLQELEAQATTYARQNRGKETPNLYAESGTTKLTKERAYASMLEEHPEVYGAFVAQHNAKGLIATLERAGVRLAR